MDKKSYVIDFLQKIDMNLDEMPDFISASESLLDLYDMEIMEICKEYQITKKISVTLEKRESLSQKSGIHIYTINALVIMLSFIDLKKDYMMKGYSDELFFETVSDLKYKMIECMQVKKIWGVFVEAWYDVFMRMEIFKLGRFQYIPGIFKHENSVKLGPYEIHPGDRTYAVHIPACGPMPKEMRYESYKLAYSFFEKENQGKPMFFTCSSWLMYEENRIIFPNHLNIIDFMNEWNIIKSVAVDGYADCWRLFGCEYSGNPHELPTDNTPRRAMAEWLKQGKKAGVGVGVMAFDGEEIIV